jgi:hypothetical protein
MRRASVEVNGPLHGATLSVLLVQVVGFVCGAILHGTDNGHGEVQVTLCAVYTWNLKLNQPVRVL